MPEIVAADLDAYEASRRERADLQARFDAAIERWDRLDMKRLLALAVAYDLRHPGQPSLRAELESLASVPAAA